jgi:hypothetical protein
VKKKEGKYKSKRRCIEIVAMIQNGTHFRESLRRNLDGLGLAPSGELPNRTVEKRQGDAVRAHEE